MVRFRSFSDVLYKSWGRGKTKRGLQEESKLVYRMKRESKEGLDNIDGSQPSSDSGVIIMQRLVSDQTSAPTNDIPPPVADHRSRRSQWSRREGGQRAGPASRGARQSQARVPRPPVISPSFPGHQDQGHNVRICLQSAQ